MINLTNRGESVIVGDIIIINNVDEKLIKYQATYMVNEITIEDDWVCGKVSIYKVTRIRKDGKPGTIKYLYYDTFGKKF